jgi:diguanylate cyclase (GGDEF)-like protein/PAS domain S-box-containing protein
VQTPGPIRKGNARAAGVHDVKRLFELSSDLLATFDDQGRFIHLNPAWRSVLGWSPAELLGRRAIELVHPDDADRTLALSKRRASGGIAEFENRYRCKDGSYRWLEWNAQRREQRWYAVARDVTDRRRLQQQALRDPLTGLPNRAAFVDRLTHALARLERTPGLVAVLFVDLDRFKVVNDGHGHEVGDRFLKLTAERLSSSVRGIDTVARFGGDEFVILVDDADDARDVVEVGERVVGALEREYRISRDELSIGASVGIAVTRHSSTAPETLLREADIAMYRAKGQGGGRCELFDELTRTDVERRVRVESDLRRAILEDQLRVYYQPIVALPEMSVTRCEALVRWEHPTRGLLLPDDFVPLAEETGLIVQIGEFVMAEACRQAQVWRRAGKDIGVTVNVSTRQLAQPVFVKRVRQVLDDTGLPPGSLCLEITETSIMEHAERVGPSLATLQRLGVLIAMDDFGSGYSSLTYLKALPLDIIKIDKSFVAEILESSQDRAIVSAILLLARETELAVIAEGIETPQLHAEVVGLNCGLGQGFLYDQPKPPEELELDGYSSRVTPGVGDPLVIREFMRQIGIPARIRQ